MSIDRTPIYLTIREQLRADIAAGRLRVGDRLPSEPELAVRYRTTRNTVRNAIARLVFEGVVERRIGRGSFVAQGGRHESIIDTTLRQSFEDQMAARGIAVTHRLLDFAPVACPPRPAAALLVPTGSTVHLLRRLRLVADEIVGIELRHILPEVAQRIPPADLLASSAIAMVEAAIGAPLSDLEVTVYAEPADAELGRLLGCRRGAALLTRRHLFRGPGGKPLLFGESCYRGDRYRFTYHLGRDGTVARFSAEGRPV
jgi:GntR family transcriptional regulator